MSSPLLLFPTDAEEAEAAGAAAAYRRGFPELGGRPAAGAVPAASSHRAALALPDRSVVEGLSVAPPEGWSDDSRIIMVRGDVPGGAAIIFARDAAATLTECQDRTLARLRAQCAELEVLASEPDRLKNRSAHTFRLRFATPLGPLEQTMVLVGPDAADPSTAILLASAHSTSVVEPAFRLFRDIVRIDDPSPSTDALARRFGAFSFTPLPGWSESFNLAFRSPASTTCGVFVTSAPMRRDELFEAFVDEALARLERNGTDFRLHDRGAHAPVEGRRATTLRYEIAGAHEEVMVLVAPPPSPAPKVTIFSATAARDRRALDHAEATLEELLGSVRFDARPPAEGRS